MDWFYALNKQQQGPVDSATLRALFQGGTINAETLVWHAGLDGWKPYTEIATSLETEAPTPAAAPAGDLPDFMTGAAAAPATLAPQDMATCAHSGKVAPKKDMLQYGEHWLIPENKDAFIAALQQGTAVMPGEIRTNMIPVGFWWRVLAQIIDGIIFYTGTLVCFIPAMLIGGAGLFFSGFSGQEIDPDVITGQLGALIVGYGLSFVLYLAFAIFYYIYLVGKNGGTPGKRIFKFTIVKADGENISYLRAFGRAASQFGLYLVGYIIGLLILVGSAVASTGGTGTDPTGIVAGLGIFVMVALIALPYLWVAWDKKKRGLHDLVCSTRVIRD